MKNKINRREWLRNSALLTGGVTLLPGIFNRVSAKDFSINNFKHHFDDKQFAYEYEEVLPNLKARLFANENPFGPSDAAKKAISDAISEGYRYPIKQVAELEQKILDFEGLKEGQIMTSSGSSPLLRAAAIYYSRPGSNIVTASPTYEDLPEHCANFDIKINYVPLNANYEYDLDAMEKVVDANTSLVYVCNPNNPTGTMVSGDKLRAFCERISKRTTVFVDEAYIDYADDPQATSMIDCVKRGMNIIVARTFSKLYGFAGLRIGYILSQPEVIKKFAMYTAGNWCISGPSAAGAIAAFKEPSYMTSALQKTQTSKEYLYKILKEEGYEYIPSHTNFVMFPIKMDGKKFTDEMMKRGVGVRFWQFNNKQWCRISIGRMDEMQAFAEAFKEIS
jgi:histidinol-phosphate aminotransferase